MNSRKEMIPAPLRRMRKGMPVFCKPEWDLLCKIRWQLLKLLAPNYPGAKRARDIKKKLKGMLANMDDVFDDWPEDPK